MSTKLQKQYFYSIHCLGTLSLPWSADVSIEMQPSPSSLFDKGRSDNKLLMSLLSFCVSFSTEYLPREQVCFARTNNQIGFCYCCLYTPV